MSVDSGASAYCQTGSSSSSADDAFFAMSGHQSIV